MESVDKLLAALTVDEKAALLEGVDNWKTHAVPRLGIPALFLTDGPHGLRKAVAKAGGFGVADNEPATAFPTSAAVASSWDPRNARRMGEAIAGECRTAGVHVLLAPGVNIKRSPLCGRNFEYYSEDPLLSGEMGAAFVEGVQSRGVGCSVKHYAANSNEDYRFYGDSLVDERALREIYLRAFERVVRRAAPWTVMGAYNRLNGVFLCQNQALLTGILRREWGFDGLVMTDWGAVSDRVKGVLAGCDLEMPGGVRHNRQAVLAAARSGALPEDTLNAGVGRVLQLIARCSAAAPAAPWNRDAHAALSCAIARDSAVLLKNDGVLPLTGRDRLLVVGAMFEKMRYQGAGSSLVNPTSVITPRDAFDRRGVQYAYHAGYRSDDARRDESLEAAALAAAKKADTVLFFGGLTDFEETEGFDRPHMALGENQTALLNALVAQGKKVVLVLYAGAPVELPFFDGLAALLMMYLPGMHGGEATAALLLGEANPSGKLAESWPLTAADTSCHADFGRGPRSRYYESIYVGYRYYDKAGTTLRFPFGYGLSYTTFAYRNLCARVAAGRVTIAADITNTGGRDGAEVVQLYVRNAPGAVFKADKELRAFTKVTLKAGETRRVVMEFPMTDLACWNVQKHSWVLENGVYELCLAASCADVRLTVKLAVTGGQDAPTPYPPAVMAAYENPPASVPGCYAALLGYEPPPLSSPLPLTLESPLKDLKLTFWGRILYRAITGRVAREYEEALKMPDSPQRDGRVKNTYFLVRMIPANSLRSMAMSSGGAFPYELAVGFVHIANGRLIRGLKAMIRKEPVLPLAGD